MEQENIILSHITQTHKNNNNMDSLIHKVVFKYKGKKTRPQITKTEDIIYKSFRFTTVVCSIQRDSNVPLDL